MDLIIKQKMIRYMRSKNYVPFERVITPARKISKVFRHVSKVQINDSDIQKTEKVVPQTR